MIWIIGHRALIQKSFMFTAFHIMLFLLTAYQRCDVIGLQCFITAFRPLVAAAVFLNKTPKPFCPYVMTRVRRHRR